MEESRGKVVIYGGKNGRTPMGLLRFWVLIAILVLATGCRATQTVAPDSFLPETRVAVFSSQTEQWVAARFSELKPGSEFTYGGHLYRMDDSGKASAVPGIDSDKLAQADRPYDDTSYHAPEQSDAVQVLDADLMVTRHALLEKVEPRTRLCFHGRVYYLEPPRHLVYRGILAETKNQPSGSAPRKSLVPSQPVEISQSALRHVVDRHTMNGAANAGKSVFYSKEDPRILIDNAKYWIPTQQPNGNMQRVIDAGHSIGIYRTTDRPTDIYTVITTSSGQLVTAFPGLP